MNCGEQNVAKPSSAGRATAKPASTPKVAHAEPASPEAVSAVPWQEPEWGSLVAEMSLPGAVRLLAGNCAYLQRDGNTVCLSIDPRSESLLTRPRKEALANALSDRFGESLVVDIAIGAAADETPLQEETRRADDCTQGACVNIANSQRGRARGAAHVL